MVSRHFYQNVLFGALSRVYDLHISFCNLLRIFFTSLSIVQCLNCQNHFYTLFYSYDYSYLFFYVSAGVSSRDRQFTLRIQWYNYQWSIVTRNFFSFEPKSTSIRIRSTWRQEANAHIHKIFLWTRYHSFFFVFFFYVSRLFDMSAIGALKFFFSFCNRFISLFWQTFIQAH